MCNERFSDSVEKRSAVSIKVRLESIRFDPIESFVFQILSGDRCEPVLLYDIPRGGASLSILLVSKSLTEVKFILADNEKNQVHVFCNDVLSESADVDRPIRCCAARKAGQNDRPVVSFWPVNRTVLKN